VTSALEAELARLRSRYDANPGGRVFAPLADCYRKLGRLDEALDVCLEGLDEHPGYTTAHVIRGKIHRDRQEPDAAFMAFEQVVELDDQNLLARRECAMLAEQLGHVRKAYEHWNRLLAADPNSAEAESAIERLAESPSLADPVDASLGVATEHIPSVGQAPRAPVLAAADLSEPEQAEEPEAATQPEPTEQPEPEAKLSEDADESADARGIATITLARIYYDQGFKARALDVYERILAENPEDGELLAKVETIRAELDQIESKAAGRAGDAGDLLEGSERGGAAADRPAEPQAQAQPEDPEVSREVEVLAASIEATDPQRRDYSQFRSWLNRVQEDDKD
jgi:tetratricopeptide (TPR) repeat protein